jgi:hypothetical protein
VQLGFAGIVHCASTPGQGRVLQTRWMHDGTLQTFSIPSGEVLVIERMTVSGATAAAAAPSNVSTALMIGGLVAWDGVAPLIGTGTIGRFTMSPTFSPGIVVKPGVEICVRTGVGSGGGRGMTSPRRFSLSAISRRTGRRPLRRAIGWRDSDGEPVDDRAQRAPIPLAAPAETRHSDAERFNGKTPTP